MESEVRINSRFGSGIAPTTEGKAAKKENLTLPTLVDDNPAGYLDRTEIEVPSKIEEHPQFRNTLKRKRQPSHIVAPPLPTKGY